MINLTKPPAFQFRLTCPDAVPAVIPMSQWIVAANDDILFTERKK